jgi:hypothetical protein
LLHREYNGIGEIGIDDFPAMPAAVRQKSESP